MFAVPKLLNYRCNLNNLASVVCVLDSTANNRVAQCSGLQTSSTLSADYTRGTCASVRLVPRPRTSAYRRNKHFLYRLFDVRGSLETAKKRQIHVCRDTILRRIGLPDAVENETYRILIVELRCCRHENDHQVFNLRRVYRVTASARRGSRRPFARNCFYAREKTILA